MLKLHFLKNYKIIEKALEINLIILKNILKIKKYKKNKIN